MLTIHLVIVYIAERLFASWYQDPLWWINWVYPEPNGEYSIQDVKAHIQGIRYSTDQQSLVFTDKQLWCIKS